MLLPLAFLTPISIEISLLKDVATLTNLAAARACKPSGLMSVKWAWRIVGQRSKISEDTNGIRALRQALYESLTTVQFPMPNQYFVIVLT